MRAEKMKTIIIILLLLVSTSAMAQQQTIYGRDGKVIGRIKQPTAKDRKRSTTPAGASPAAHQPTAKAPRRSMTRAVARSGAHGGDEQRTREPEGPRTGKLVLH